VSGHTPGPWEWDCGLVPPDGPERYADIYTEGGDTIIARFNDLIPEGLANARLISAAPAMLEALKSVREWLLLECPVKDDGIWNSLFVQANNLTNEAIRLALSASPD
jgi:hypothetical protein